MNVEIDISGAYLETTRLILRPWRKEDIADFYEYASVPGVGEAAGWRNHASVGESERILDVFIAERNVLAIVYKANGKAIGSLGFHRSWAEDDPAYTGLRLREIGYVLSKDYWGQGLMPEAVERAIGYGFEVLGLDALTVCHFRENDRSRRVIEKCGFRFVKSGIYHSDQLERDFDDLEYILTREEYISRRG